METLALKIGTFVFSEYGLLGVLLVGMSLYILKKEKDHREERKEFMSTWKQTTDRAVDAQDRNTQVLAEVKTLIETLAKK